MPDTNTAVVKSQVTQSRFRPRFTTIRPDLSQMVKSGCIGMRRDGKKENQASIRCLTMLHVRIQRGGGTEGPDPPPLGKSQKYRVSEQFWCRSHEKLRSYRASIQCWAIISLPAKRHLNGVSLTGRR